MHSLMLPRVLPVRDKSPETNLLTVLAYSLMSLSDTVAPRKGMLFDISIVSDYP
jgi:hypothetical protein